MAPEKAYPFLTDRLSPFWKRHRKTLALVIAAIAVTGQARSFAIATTLARWLNTRLDSAVNRFYRLLRNARVDYTELGARWARLLARGKERSLLVAVDWTEWHHDLRMLSAAVVTGKRAIPLYTQAFNKEVPRRSQNTRENTFLRLLAEAVRRASAQATILCDRGFRRVSWVKLLQDLRLSFVVRLMDDVQVELVPGIKLPLRHVLLRQGSVLDLGVVAVRSDGKVRVRVVGYWAPGAHEPWWLATSEAGAASRVVKLYDRRMAIEEQFRDTKGRRFGVKLYWTQFRDPDALARFVMLLAIALLIWMLAGKAAAHRDPSLLLRHRKKGPRQSHVTIGLRIVTLDASHMPITRRTISRLLEPPPLRQLGKLAPGGK
jgi:hypothetical protein